MSLIKKEKWWKTPPYAGIVSSLSAALIIWIVSLIYKSFNAPPTVSTFKGIMTFVFNNLLFVFNLELKLWWIFVILISSIILIFSYKQVKVRRTTKLSDDFRGINDVSYEDTVYWQENLEIRKEDMLAFTAVKFKHVVWTWEWVFNKKIKEYEPKNIVPHCPTKDCEDVILETTDSLLDAGKKRCTCPNCLSILYIDSEPFEVEDHIMKLANQITNPPQ